MKRIEFKYRIELITRNRELIEGACLKYKCLKVDIEILIYANAWFPSILLDTLITASYFQNLFGFSVLTISHRLIGLVNGAKFREILSNSFQHFHLQNSCPESLKPVVSAIRQLFFAVGATAQLTKWQRERGRGRRRLRGPSKGTANVKSVF